jgi:Protein of unknown function (DUF2973)
MLHLLYILAFTFLAFVAVGNLIRNLLHFSQESSRTRPATAGRSNVSAPARAVRVPHPELLDDDGHVISEPLLVMRSISVEDARQQLDALYNSSPGANRDLRDEDGKPPSTFA